MFTGKTYISKALKCYCTFKACDSCKLQFIVIAIFSGIHARMCVCVYVSSCAFECSKEVCMRKIH